MVSSANERVILAMKKTLEILKVLLLLPLLWNLALENLFFDIKRGREKIIKFSSECDSRSLKKCCIAIKADNEISDRAIHLSFVDC